MLGNESKTRIGILGLLVSAALVFLSACADRPGGGYAGVAETPAVTKTEATNVKLKSQLVRTTLVSSDETKNEIYRISDVHFGADAESHIISAEIKVVSSGGTETIRLAGKIRENGTATLLDITPKTNPRTTDANHRLMAEAYCDDLEACERIILNVWYKVGDELVKRQFVSEQLEKESKPPVMPGASEKPVPRQEPAQPPEEVEEDDDDYPIETEPDVVWGEFVGAPRNEEFVEQLWNRPLVPEVVPEPVVEAAPELPEEIAPDVPRIDGVAKSTGKIPVPSPRPQTEKEEKAEYVAIAKEAARVRAQIAKDKAMAAAAEKAAALIKEKLAEAQAKEEAARKAKAKADAELAAAEAAKKREETAAKIKAEEAARKAKAEADAALKEAQAVKAREEAAKRKAEEEAARLKREADEAAKQREADLKKVLAAKEQRAAQLKAEQEKAEAERKAQEKKDKEEAEAAQKAEAERKALEAKQTAEERRKQTQDRMKEIESRLSPFLELSKGGRASGFYSEKGSISDSSPLPMSGKGFQRIHKDRERFYGAGIMISLITMLAGEFVTKYFPGSVIYLGDISQKSGGRLKNSQHRSHQNGLDADIAFIGNTSFTTVIKGGRMSPNFQYAKNWQFWRLVASQQIVQDNKQVSVLTQIYVNPVIKRGLCSWAKKHEILSNPLDKELMRRVRAWSGHDKHFHLRIRCSPYYPTCRNQGDPVPGTGC